MYKSEAWRMSLKKFVVVSLFAFILSGCVKVNILPEDAVKNSIRAGKSIYDEAKLKREGGEKREYSKQVKLSEFSSNEEAENYCFQALRKKLTFDSSKRAPVIISEKILILDGQNSNLIECQIAGSI
jgi:hypothetical protein